VDCLPNKEIFAELARMSYEKPSIKLTFYKAFFSSQWKFLIHNILQSLSTKRTSWNEFSSAMVFAVICLSTEEHVQDVADSDAAQGDGTAVPRDDAPEPTIPSPTLPTPPPQPPQDLPSTSQDDVVALMNDKDEYKKEEEAKEDEPAEVQEVVDVVTTAKIITKVVTTASETVTAASTIIFVAEPQVPAATITVAPVRVFAASTKRRKGMVIRDPEEESTTSLIIPADTKSKDKGKGIMVEEPKPLKKKQQVKMDEEYARKLYAELNKYIDWDVAIDHEQMEEEESRELQSINETPAQKAAKRRKVNEEVEDLKRHLKIVPDEYDDVYTEATPLARKVPVVDYEIINLNNKPYYKIIRADGTHQLYISFLTLLKNFDREDLKAL
nr:hypothetical protein [Tanacetum cinerariifolium]